MIGGIRVANWHLIDSVFNEQIAGAAVVVTYEFIYLFLVGREPSIPL